ncbi:hypothetical protein IFM89_011274 [Coptis chinensis]|uniref:V-SNARE coiled-coil homology domain-containing protein n=1 Tax=Coptis chinensis TaxID=261450 RepID=A0A835HCA7_9MAGN|nr:hypothetical protein IFM89_011274 [Coptis chinensis]
MGRQQKLAVAEKRNGLSSPPKRSRFPSSSSSSSTSQQNVTLKDLNPRVEIHYGIPSTASILAFDPFQRLLAIGTLDGRIKVIGGDNIEGLLISPNSLPFKSLEFLHNQGFLVSVSNGNDVEVWDLENRCLTSYLQWECNITAFSVISSTCFMFIGDEYGSMSVLKYDAEEGKLLQLPYHVPSSSISDVTGVSLPSHESIVAVLPQPCTSGNRVLIAYGNGLIILWDVIEAQVVLVKGNKDLQLEDDVFADSPANHEAPDPQLDHIQEEKEISSICWASSNGSILAVGYVDGDIMLWNISSSSSTNNQRAGRSFNGVVKLQLSSNERRIPVIVLHWAEDSQSHKDCKGQLFIYGGDEIGSEEVLTVLSLEWSSGVENLKCIGRVDLTLGGSFADMILVPKSGSMKNDVNAALFVLTNPGQLHVYNDINLSAIASPSEKLSSLPTMKFPVVIPMANPDLTAAKLCVIPKDENLSKALLEIASIVTFGATPTVVGSEWPLTGGVPSQLSFAEEKRIERIYIAGYQDGSVRLWDATFPVFSLIFCLEDEVKCTSGVEANSPVTALEFCSLGTSLAVGKKSGLVSVYKLFSSAGDTSFHFVTETNHEDIAASSSSPVISIVPKPFPDIGNLKKSPKHSGFKNMKDLAEGDLEQLSQNSIAHSEPVHTSIGTGAKSEEVELHTSTETVYSGDRLLNSVVLLCSETALRLYSVKSLMRGDKNSVCKVKLAKPCCWTTTIKKKGENPSGLILLYQTGLIEIRSLPDLELVSESSLMSILRWGYKANMNQTMSSSNSGLIALANGSELAFISIFIGENDFRIPESLPCLHDKVLAAAADAAISYSSNQKKKQGSGPGILSGIMKGFKGKKVGYTANAVGNRPQSCLAPQVENVFSRMPFAEPSADIADYEEAELNIGPFSFFSHLPFLSPSLCFALTHCVSNLIDDIEIDDPVEVVSTSTYTGKSDSGGTSDKKSEREKLFEDATMDMKPRLRTQDEIIAKYRKAGDASAVAAQARDKLLQRQEKLERIRKNTEELQSGAENFASMANELVKVMEARKWYHI